MREEIDLILGFDPGGRNDRNFGWSVCRAIGNSSLSLIEASRTIDALAAIDAVNKVIDDLSNNCHTNKKPRVLSAGIDAPLRWGKRGNRKLDVFIENELGKCLSVPGEKPASVQRVNSLRGAATVQGVLLGKYLYHEYNSGHHTVKITETHPTALRQLLFGTTKVVIKNDYQELETLLKELTGPDGGQHRRDATIGAFAAWKLHVEADGWQDIYLKDGKLDDDLLADTAFAVPCSYWMPI